MDQYAAIRAAIAAVDALLRQAAVTIATRVALVGDGPITPAQARRVRALIRAELAPLYGPSRARAVAGALYREIARAHQLTAQTTYGDIVRELDRTLAGVDAATWATTRAAVLEASDDLGRLWGDLGGPATAEVRRTRATFVDVNRRWVDGSRYRLSDAIWEAGLRTRNDIDKRIRIGLRRGESPLTIARRIEKYLNPDYASLRYEAGGRIVRRYRSTPNAASAARRLARTEVQHAAHAATVAFVDDLAIPGAGVQWTLSNAHPRIDICDDLARRSSRGYPRGVYRPEDFPQIPHPQCLCGARPVLPDPAIVLEAIQRRYAA